MKKKLTATMQADMVLSYSEILNALGDKSEQEVADAIDSRFTWGNCSQSRISIPKFLAACMVCPRQTYRKVANLLNPFEQYGAMIELTD